MSGLVTGHSSQDRVWYQDTPFRVAAAVALRASPVSQGGMLGAPAPTPAPAEAGLTAPKRERERSRVQLEKECPNITRVLQR